MTTTTKRPDVFYTSPLLVHETGQQVFCVDDPDRTPLTVLRRVYGACGRREIVVCQQPGAEPIRQEPSRLVRVNEAQRPTREQLDESRNDMFRMVDAHTEDCPWCKRQSVFWGTSQRCIFGKRMIEALFDLSAYREKIHPWLHGLPLEPGLAYRGQPVTVRRPGQPDVEGTVTNVTFPEQGGIDFHQPGQMGQVLVNLPGREVPEMFPIEQVYPRP
ncbi:hypothetical protein ACPCBF_25335 [Streptomyces pseudogriseolus]|uniref:hypothetical protein n=1 Tax=Streptomyces pseudogriseolus TaxID=36817 RepID=UPI003FA2E02E